MREIRRSSEGRQSRSCAASLGVVRAFRVFGRRRDLHDDLLGRVFAGVAVSDVAPRACGSCAEAPLRGGASLLYRRTDKLSVRALMSELVFVGKKLAEHPLRAACAAGVLSVRVAFEFGPNPQGASS